MNFCRLVLLVLIGACSVKTLAATNQIGPSFPCARAFTSVEKDICQSPEISLADLYLAELYQLNLAQFPDIKDELTQSQNEWLKKHRNKACLDGDFSWSQLDTASFDQSTPLLACYKIRIHELRSGVDLPETFIKKWIMRFRLSGYSQNIGPTAPHNMPVPKAAQIYFTELRGRMLAKNYGYSCASEDVMLDYADEIFMRISEMEPLCSEERLPKVIAVKNLCKEGDTYKPIENYWACYKKSKLTDALNDIKQKIANGFFINLLRSDGSPKVNKEEDLAWSLTRSPALVFNHPMFYTAESIDWAIQNKALFKPILQKYKPQFTALFRHLDTEKTWIQQQDNWQEKLKAMTGSPLGVGEIIPPSDEIKKSYSQLNLSNTLYNLHEFYVQVWARLYQNGGMEKAAEAIKVFQAELQQ